jgi:hypothetical protein
MNNSCIWNPKSEMCNWTGKPLARSAVQSNTSDFGFQMQESFIFGF